MTAHALNCDPEECCGLIAMDPIGEIRFVYPLTNLTASSTSFLIDPDESYGAFMHADRSGWRIGGVFHSHPNGPSQLSSRDIEDATDPRWLHFLVREDELKCFRIHNGVAVGVTVLDG